MSEITTVSPMERGPQPTLREVYDWTRRPIVDYEHLGDDAANRKAGITAFKAGEADSPGYDYPKLRPFSLEIDGGYEVILDDDGNPVLDEEGKEERVYIPGLLSDMRDVETGMWLASQMDEDSPEGRIAYYSAAASLAMGHYIREMGRLNGMHDGNAKDPIEVRQTRFMELGESLYGTIDQALFDRVWDTKRAWARDVVPQNEYTTKIKQELADMGVFDGEFEAGEPIVTQELVDAYHDVIWDLFGEELGVISDEEVTQQFTSEQCAERMTRVFEIGGLIQEGWVVEVDEKASLWSVNAAIKKLKIPAGRTYTGQDIRRYIVHEYATHALKAFNGSHTPLSMLETGLPDYLDAEEGEATLSECFMLGTTENIGISRAFDRYVHYGLALGADGGEPRNAQDVFEITWRMQALIDGKGVVTPEIEAKAKDAVYLHVENMFRSTDFTVPGLIFPKLKVYLEGIVKIKDYLGQYAEADELTRRRIFKQLKVGKHDVTNPEHTEPMQDMGILPIAA